MCVGRCASQLGSRQCRARVQTIQIEETAFGKTLKTGAQVFNKKTAGIPKGGVLDGAVIFELYDAYGYPVDLTELMAEEVGLTCDMEGCVALACPKLVDPKLRA